MSYAKKGTEHLLRRSCVISQGSVLDFSGVGCSSRNKVKPYPLADEFPRPVLRVAMPRPPKGVRYPFAGFRTPINSLAVLYF